MYYCEEPSIRRPPGPQTYQYNQAFKYRKKYKTHLKDICVVYICVAVELMPLQQQLQQSYVSCPLYCHMLMLCLYPLMMNSPKHLELWFLMRKWSKRGEGAYAHIKEVQALVK